MKKFGRLKLFGLVVILTMALIFMAINFLEAKKPLQWEWEVYIPGVSTEWNLYAYDVDGFPSGNLFTDTGPIFVRVKRIRNVPYSFTLSIDNDPRENEEKIGFEGLDLVFNDDKPSGEGPCSFPDYGPCQGLYDYAPYCMQSFLETYPHPYTNDTNENYDYETFWLSIDVDCDIEGMNPQETLSPSGNVHIEIHKTDSVLPGGCGDLHGIVVGRDVDEGSEVITITKLTKDSWRIEVDTTVDTENDTINFVEVYWDYQGKGKGKFVTKKPIRAKAPFKFTTMWTRSPQ